jgi:hypothetical protein
LSHLTTRGNATNATYVISEHGDSYAVATTGKIVLYPKAPGGPLSYVDIPGDPLAIVQLSTGDVHDIAVLTADSRVYLASNPAAQIELPEGNWRTIDWDAAAGRLIAITQWNRIMIVPLVGV